YYWFEAGDGETAFEWTNRAAAKGHGEAVGLLGEIYEVHKEDYQKAKECYEQSALQGDYHAKYCLGRLYFDGKGVEQDYERAFELFKESAEEGDAEAKYMLGLMYFE